jgi:hypothetical protein
VRSDFEPSDPGWKFWKYFHGIDRRLGDAAADVLFRDEAGQLLPNDMVVDTGSMNDWIEGNPIPTTPERTLDFGRNDRVHHTNYFVQPETLKFLRAKTIG